MSKSNCEPCWMCVGSGTLFNAKYISKIFKVYTRTQSCPICDQVRLIHINNHVEPLTTPNVAQQRYNEDGL